MFELLSKYPAVLARHREGPSAEDRDKFLQHCADQGMAYGTLLRVARELLVIARHVDVGAQDAVSHRTENAEIILPAARETDLAQIEPDPVRAFLAVGPVTRFWQRKHEVLAGFYRFAVARG